MSTALVHEAYIRLLKQGTHEFENRAHSSAEFSSSPWHVFAIVGLLPVAHPWIFISLEYIQDQ